MALIYVKRFIATTGIHGRINYQKLVGVAFFLAQKFHNDREVWYMPEFSLISGISVRKIEKLEREFCRSIDYKLYVSPEEYEYSLACIELNAQ